MSLINIKIALISLTSIIIININEASKCGDFFCNENSECKYNSEKSEHNCICNEGYIRNISDKVNNCYLPEVAEENGKCFHAGDKCGPFHECDTYLICQESSDENVDIIEPKLIDIVCETNQQKCFDKCCQENEECQNGVKCIARDLASDCPESLKCPERCCSENEICIEQNKCVAKGAAVAKCPEDRSCQDSCCTEKEICINGIKCVAKEQISVEASSECPESQRCQHKCCAKNEICGDENECIPKEKCPKNLLCNEKCCAENEICDKDNVCTVVDTKCHESQVCQEKCCTVNQVCSEESVCVEVKACPVSQMCQDKCCSEHEKCSEHNVCIINYPLECHETDRCGNKCCAVNETCNEDNECAGFLEITTIENCPQKQKCLLMCCTLNEVCSELNECVNKSVEENANLYYTGIEDRSEIKDDFDSIIPLFDFENLKEPEELCPFGHFVCHHKCCNAQQICNANGECVEVNSDRICGPGKNCTRYFTITNDKISSSTAYTMIGLGCLVAVLSFGLYKVYYFRSRNVF